MNALVVDASVWVAAADASDSFSDASRVFLSAVTGRAVALAIPDLAEVEVACALSRRLRDGEKGAVLARLMIQSPLVTVHPTQSSLLRQAIDTGTRRLLRGGEAIYAALAEQMAVELISWDGELIQRAGATTPTGWLERNAVQDAEPDPASEKQ